MVRWSATLQELFFMCRRDRRSLVGLSRKNGKSLLGSLCALYQLIEGEPGAEVYSAAGDRQQARVVFNEAKWQITQSPALSGVCKVYRDVIEVPSTGAIYRVLSSDAKLQQGLNPSCVVFDELHVQRDSELWDALTLGSGARKDPMIVAITTAGFDLLSLVSVTMSDLVSGGGKHRKVVLFMTVKLGRKPTRTWLKVCSTWKTWRSA